MHCLALQYYIYSTLKIFKVAQHNFAALKNKTLYLSFEI